MSRDRRTNGPTPVFVELLLGVGVVTFCPPPTPHLCFLLSHSELLSFTGDESSAFLLRWLSQQR